MESLYLLIPLSVLLVLGIGGLLAWSVMAGQFDGLEREGERILDDDAAQDALAAGPARDSGTTARQQRSNDSGTGPGAEVGPAR
jgi:cbb3-type cytochrome oxidase maturation protein